MKIEKLEVGDRFWNADHLMTTKVIRVWCECNSTTGRWECWVETGSVLLDGGFVFPHSMLAHDFVSVIENGNYKKTAYHGDAE